MATETRAIVVRADREGGAPAGTRHPRAGRGEIVQGAGRSYRISLFMEISQLIRCGISTIMVRSWAAPRFGRDNPDKTGTRASARRREHLSPRAGSGAKARAPKSTALRVDGIAIYATCIVCLLSTARQR